jgi:hypothetical protein
MMATCRSPWVHLTLQRHQQASMTRQWLPPLPAKRPTPPLAALAPSLRSFPRAARRRRAGARCSASSNPIRFVVFSSSGSRMLKEVLGRLLNSQSLRPVPTVWLWASGSPLAHRHCSGHSPVRRPDRAASERILRLEQVAERQLKLEDSLNSVAQARRESRRNRSSSASSSDGAEGTSPERDGTTATRADGDWRRLLWSAVSLRPEDHPREREYPTSPIRAERAAREQDGMRRRKEPLPSWQLESVPRSRAQSVLYRRSSRPLHREMDGASHPTRLAPSAGLAKNWPISRLRVSLQAPRRARQAQKATGPKGDRPCAA